MSTSTPTTSTDRRRSARNKKMAPVNTQEINSDNSNDGDDKQNTRSSDTNRGESSTYSKRKDKDVLMESNDNDETHNDSDNNNGMDNNDNGQLILSRIMNTEKTSVRSRTKKPLTNIYGDDHDDKDVFKSLDENLNNHKDPPDHVFLKGKASWNKGKTTSEETKVSVMSFSHFHAMQLLMIICVYCECEG